MARQSALPPTLPPRLIGREAAAAYINVSPETFDKMVESGKMPKPKCPFGRLRDWDVREIDTAVDRLPRADPDATWEDVDAP
jgi:predicted DNA-binding transcriptional regulator AlpA